MSGAGRAGSYQNYQAKLTNYSQNVKPKSEGENKSSESPAALTILQKLQRKPPSSEHAKKRLEGGVTRKLTDPQQKNTAKKTKKHTPPTPFKKPARTPPKAPSLPPVPPRPGSTAAKTKKHTPPSKPLPQTPLKTPARSPPKAPNLPPVPPRPGSTAAKTKKHTPPSKPLPQTPLKTPARSPPKAPNLPPVPQRPSFPTGRPPPVPRRTPGKRKMGGKDLTSQFTKNLRPASKGGHKAPVFIPGKKSSYIPPQFSPPPASPKVGKSAYKPPPKASGLRPVPQRPSFPTGRPPPVPRSTPGTRKMGGKDLPSQFTKNLRPASKAGHKPPVFILGKPPSPVTSQFTPPPAVRSSKPQKAESKPLNEAQKNLEKILTQLERGKKGKVKQKDLQNAFKEIAKLKNDETFFEITNNDGTKTKVDVRDIALKLAEHPKAGKALKNKGVRKSLEEYVSNHQKFATGNKTEELKNLKKPKQLQNFITSFSKEVKEAELNNEIIEQKRRQNPPQNGLLTAP